MMVNKNRPHVLILPEDDANRQLANGFHLEVGSIRQMQVLQVASGWRNVLARFKSDQESDMRRYPHRHMVLLIDFDNQEDRLDIAKNVIPDDLKDRVLFSAHKRNLKICKGLASALPKPSGGRWQEIVAKIPMRLGGTIF